MGRFPRCGNFPTGRLPVIPAAPVNQEPGNGDHHRCRGGAFRQGAGQHQQGAGGKDDEEDPELLGRAEWMQVEHDRIAQPGGRETHHQRGRDAVPVRERERPQ